MNPPDATYSSQASKKTAILLHAVHAVQGEDTGDVLVGAHDDDRPVS